MHPIYKLKETNLYESHQEWIGRKVVDRYGQAIGHVKEILVEERTFDDAILEDQNPLAWEVRPHLVVVHVERRPLDRFRRQPVVMLPLDKFTEKGKVLVANADGGEIRVALTS